MKDESAKPVPGINWGKFRTEYVRLETGYAKKLKLAKWRQVLWFNSPGLRFDVLEEDSKPVNKIFSTTSKRLIRELKPIVQKAEEQGRTEISVSILKTGEGLNTLYEVKNV